jgi:quinol monooxygenase YgiN
MDRGITVTLKMHIAEDVEGRFINSLPDLICATSSAPGARSVCALRQSDNANTILFVEEWESEQAFNAYIAWRTKRGDMEQLKHVLSKPPEISIWRSATSQ